MVRRGKAEILDLGTPGSAEGRRHSANYESSRSLHPDHSTRPGFLTPAAGVPSGQESPGCCPGRARWPDSGAPGLLGQGDLASLLVVHHPSAVTFLLNISQCLSEIMGKKSLHLIGLL